MVNDYSELNEIHRDVLQELGNIGTGNAITALSQLTSQPVQMELPSIRIVNYEKAPLLINEDQVSNMAGVMIKVKNDLDCVVTFMLNETFTLSISEELTGIHAEHIEQLDDMQKSAICEIGNIMCNAYLNALAAMLDASLEVSVPYLEIGRCRDILGHFLKDFMVKDQQILLIENRFYYLEQEYVSQILLHPKFESLQKILEDLMHCFGD